MKAKSTILTLILMTVFSVLLLSSVSATLNLKVVSIPSSVSHDIGTIPIVFSLSNTETTAQTDLRWLGASNIGEWKNLDPLPNTINAGSQIQFTIVLSIPKHKSGSISTNLIIVSKEGLADSLNLPSILITRSPSLSITKTQDLTEAKNGIISLTNTGNIYLTQVQLSSFGDLKVTLSSTTLDIPAGNSATIYITRKDFSNLKFGKNSATITAKDAIETSASATITLSIYKAGQAGFIRGDTNSDGKVDVSDAVKILLYLFKGFELRCLDAADVNDDGNVDISDSQYLVSYLFRGGPQPSAPFSRPGNDLTVDDLDCVL